VTTDSVISHRSPARSSSIVSGIPGDFAVSTATARGPLTRTLSTFTPSSWSCSATAENRASTISAQFGSPSPVSVAPASTIASRTSLESSSHTVAKSPSS
jgi:hypothetical protein